MNKSNAMNDFLERLVPGRKEKMAVGDCVGCPNRNCITGMTQLELREYTISGLCKTCQNVVFNTTDSKKRKLLNN